MERATIALTGAQETMLATLYAHALDSRATPSILHDDAAFDVVRRIDYRFRKTGITPTSAASIALRARLLDDWTRDFLCAHPRATVLHLGCGLDTRVQRISPAATVRWIDVDMPDVVDLREELIQPPGAGSYRMIGTSVTDSVWLENLPAEGSVLAVFEGLSMHLRKSEGKRLIQRITSHFPTGQLLFDCYSSTGISMQKLMPIFRRTGSKLHWGIDDPYELEEWHSSLTCLDAVCKADIPGIDGTSAEVRAQMWLRSRIPTLRGVSRVLRYEF